MKKNRLLVRLTVLMLLALGASTGFSQDDAGLLTERAINPTVNFDDAIASISRSNDEAEMLETVDGAISKCRTYDDYEKLASDIRGLLARSPGFKRADVLEYAFAKVRLEQLGFLAKQNDIESGRLYMSVNDRYRSDALESLDKATSMTKSKSLILGIDFLKFLILKDSFQFQRIDAFLDEMANKIASYSDNADKNRAELARITSKFDMNGLSDYGMKLKQAYLSKISDTAAAGVFADIKNDADRAFAKGDMKEASMLYDQYVTSGRKYMKKDAWSAGLMEIAEKYFAATRYPEARGYYEMYLENYPDSKVLDYCSYKIGLCYYNEKNYIKAITWFEGFIEKHKNSVWFDRGFEALCRLYFMAYYPKENAIASLQKLVDNYYRKNVGDYAHLLIAILYYNDHQYDTAVPILKKIPRTSIYFNDADMLMTDINEIKKEAREPGFSYGTKDTYKVWEQYMTISSTLTPYDADAQAEMVKTTKLDEEKPIKISGYTESGIPEIKVSANSRIKIALDPLEDLDRYSSYLQDAEDISRLPRKIKEAVERDLISVSWNCDGGKFLDEDQTKIVFWEAPSAPGTCRISVVVDDLGLVRKPDKGGRKDSSKEMSIIAIVG